jgi:beta-N-acetylhexosaminidase
MVGKTQETPLGQLFMVGFPGAEPPAPFLQFLAEDAIGGVILFEENCPSHQQTRQNIERLRQASRSPHLLVAIDQEGGRVSRLRGAPAEFRSAGDYAREKNGLEHFKEEYRRSAVYMESLGINLNLAPVADIYLNNKNSVLRGRCFGSTAEEVTSFVRAAVDISAHSGLLSCLKHFPGLGSAELDPHVATPHVVFNEIVWSMREMAPFAAGIEAGADLVMTTHVVLEPLDRTIVTGSSRIINELLRSRAAFDGPVITDDLLMEGAAVLGNVGERAVKAFLAGHDILLFGRDYEAAMSAHDDFEEAYHRGEISPVLVATALDRVAGMKYKLRRTVIG